MALPFESRKPLSLADAFVATSEDATLKMRTRQDDLSALRTVGRVSGKPLERISAGPRSLAKLFKSVSPIAIGMSPRTWANVRSRVHRSVGRVQKTSPGRYQTPLLPEWQAKMDLLSKETLLGLSRLAHFCSAEGIELDAVTAETFSQFREDLDDSPLLSPLQRFAVTARAWRKAQAEAPSWPRVAVPVRTNGKRWTRTWDKFPQTLPEDIDTFFALRAADDPFAEDPFDDTLFDEKPAPVLRPSTAEGQKWLLRAFASALVLQGYDPEKLTSLRELTEIQAFKDGTPTAPRSLGSKILRGAERSPPVEDYRAASCPCRSETPR